MAFPPKTDTQEILNKIASMGHGGLDAPGSLVGGAALGAIKMHETHLRPEDMPKKGDLFKQVKAAKPQHTMKDLKRLKADNWHNPETGTEIDAESGEERLHQAMQNAASKMVNGWVKKIKGQEAGAKPEESDGMLEALTAVKKSVAGRLEKPPVARKIGELKKAVGDLAKRSKNVREKTRNISADVATRRREAYAAHIGLRVQSGGRRDQFGMGPDQRGVMLGANTGNIHHEIGHVFMSPEGKTLRENQKAIGFNKLKDNPEARVEAYRQEHAAFAMQPMLDRRAGVAAEDRGPYSGAPTNIDSPEVPSYATNQANAREALSAVEEGRKTIGPTGMVQPGTSPHAKINERLHALRDGVKKKP